MSNNKITIPQNHQEFCKAVARLAKKHGLRSFGGSFTPGFDDPWREKISFSWEAGRHGEDAGNVAISSQCNVFTEIGATNDE